jgi:hypothetical protein
MLGLVLFIVAISASLTWLLSGGIDYIKRQTSKQKGKDFFNWDKDIHNKAGRDGWDENLHDEIF